MSRCEKLLAKARNNPRGLCFGELQKLVECYGFFLDRQRSSHPIYKREGSRTRLNLQPGRDGTAKPYQVRQVLDEIERILGGGS